jgi:hypothetical protein
VPRSSSCLKKGRQRNFVLRTIGLLTNFKKVCVSKNGGLRKEIMSEAHRSLYTIHPGDTKMYRDMK